MTLKSPRSSQSGNVLNQLVELDTQGPDYSFKLLTRFKQRRKSAASVRAPNPHAQSPRLANQVPQIHDGKPQIEQT